MDRRVGRVIEEYNSVDELVDEAVRVAFEAGYRRCLLDAIDSGDTYLIKTYDHAVGSAMRTASKIMLSEGLEESSPEELACRLVEESGVCVTASDVETPDS